MRRQKRIDEHEPSRGRPEPLNEHVRTRMSQQARTGTRPEMNVRRLLHASGKRYRVAYPVPGKPRRTIDIAFPGTKVAVFIDGCFWHRCPQHSNAPANNRDWWATKLAANVKRDEDTDATLAAAGWRSVRIWEHESAATAVAVISDALAGRDHPNRKGLKEPDV